MDHFGIGAAMKGMALAYCSAVRRTGRTTSLVESVKEGDRIVFADEREATRVGNLLLDRGVAVNCVVASTQSPEEIFDRGTSEGRTIFDHGWLEQYYQRGIDAMAGKIDRLERESSGYGEAHRETRRRAIERAKWGL